MNYPINLSHYINYNLSVSTVIVIILLMMVIALWYDLFYKEECKELIIVVDKNFIQQTIESIKKIEKFEVQNCFVSGEQYEKYIEESEKREVENRKIKSEKPKYEVESYKANWVWSQFQFAKRLNFIASNPVIKKVFLIEDKTVRVNPFQFKEVENVTVN